LYLFIFIGRNISNKITNRLSGEYKIDRKQAMKRSTKTVRST